ncbi:hypothetical protein SAMN05444422_102427 [Halobiforma haloterrestris]|uniref:Uncharacterized protein n=1 Tax=Natronobacterium haloterrestre TaxID=148448 RepID=A0A1I1EFI7_NATHA|nr:hypothetical protein [Halobiforma haloterrestris]SFB85875.1 hypothetical protein SAMN05444422_102427 [Halobiforma haloterrestris]
MSSENASDRSLGDRVVDLLSELHGRYNRAEATVRRYTPYVVRVIEVVVAIGLLAGLAHWLYWVYIAGP